MREIKFRAWDGEKMLPQTGPVLGMTRGNKMVIALHTHDKDQTEETLTHNPDLVLLQFTGLKDKNGKEIYEGDIVVGCGGVKTPREVVWRNDYPGWGFFARSHDSWETGFGIDEDDQTRPHIEVIGNIYENPELLTNNKDV